MKRASVYTTALLLAVSTGVAYVWTGSVEAKKRTEATIAQLRVRTESAERQVFQLRRELGVGRSPEPVVAAAAEPAPPSSGLPPTETGSVADPSRVSDERITTLAARDILITLEQCTLSNRTLRCEFSVTNQGLGEKKFVLGVGGQYSRFEDASGGTSVFDDVGNDFLSAGGGVANRSLDNCDQGGVCRVEKTLTPRVKTAAWMRFDAVDPRMTLIKLMRMKWSDDATWVTMDFRNLPLNK
jgi:hypothetical protein